uniref:NAD kinase 2, mitochondrial n=1 Tax=Culicoides sonorensis TaxID=179676 RepID=A0A336M694_CULSO
MIKSNRIYRKLLGCKKSLEVANFCTATSIIPESKVPVSKFRPRRALIVSKLTKYEFEQIRHPIMNEEELEKFLRNRGTDYEALLYYHNLHKNIEFEVAKGFKDQGVDVKVVNRLNICPDNHLKWGDIIVPVGGDGTFLLAAGRASPSFTERQHTPVVGFNSDPKRSEGRLMLPKQYTSNIPDAVKKILTGDFKWMNRSRIRITLLGNNANIPYPIDLHEYNVGPVDHKDHFIDGPTILHKIDEAHHKDTKRMLPYLALNEVFIGETVSARVSHLHLRIDNEEKVTKTKSSGLCVSTGTGSTSWHTSINRLTKKNVQELLDILKKQASILNGVDPAKIADEFNNNLVFPPDDPRLCYSIREQICVGVWPNPKGLESRGFAKTIFVKSRCIDAGLVIDGSIAYPFNDGTRALLEIHPSDALLTVNMNE